ncbi:COP9 signalosome complex subunit 5 [Angomonas deanei]|uniref:COP9 signalosome complex subunit 5 n=1 Tax=Angomonas deanei TaxID=59799 RepID=A0A7G2BYZ4_9TRYP|nr:COP9 signalosome complex subunit 5 [Angomonas deanei]CAD2212728.1 JAB1/Mov34/MPN/PAD-1 ubiquitin protease, putative [Angomonas deanei]|eukprot:EPY21342.1 COP9 signalosome complex subunit 5 [Angomonas deanei]
MSLLKKVQVAKEQPKTGTSDKVEPSSQAKEAWLLQNNIKEFTSDCFFAPDVKHMREKREQKPWKEEMKYFTEVKVTALAALKMFIHTKTGSPDRLKGRADWYEVMGLMTGHFYNNTLIVTDSFSLPVEASEVECSMDDRSLIYQATYLNYHRNLGKPDAGCIGWYHSHPGYTCFLSGIDVNTQREGQAFRDPWLSIVVDPVRTIATGQLDFKAFRTFPTNEMKRGNERPETVPDMPSKRIKEFGMYANCYYELPITIVRSAADEVQLDALFHQYWSVAFTANPLLANRNFNTGQLELTAHLTKQAYQTNRRGKRQSNKDNFPTPIHLSNREEETYTREGNVVTTDDVYACGGSFSPLYRDAVVARINKSETDDAGQEYKSGEEGSGLSYVKRAQLAGDAVCSEIQSSTVQLEVKQSIFSMGKC